MEAPLKYIRLTAIQRQLLKGLVDRRCREVISAEAGLKACGMCEKVFEARHGNQIYCSSECVRESSRLKTARWRKQKRGTTSAAGM